MGQSTVLEAQAAGPPCRSHGQVAQLGNTLYVMGGIYETNVKELILDDMWTVDMVKMDAWKCIIENSESFIWEGN